MTKLEQKLFEELRLENSKLKKALSNIDNTLNNAESTQNLPEVKVQEFSRMTITIDERTLSKIKRFQQKKAICFSSSIRFICNSYFDDNEKTEDEIRFILKAGANRLQILENKEMNNRQIDSDSLKNKMIFLISEMLPFSVGHDTISEFKDTVLTLIFYMWEYVLKQDRAILTEKILIESRKKSEMHRSRVNTLCKEIEDRIESSFKMVAGKMIEYFYYGKSAKS